MMLLPLLVNLCVIGFATTLLGSAGHNIRPSGIFPLEGTPKTIHRGKLISIHAPSSASDNSGSNLHPSLDTMHMLETPMSQEITGLPPPPDDAAPTPFIFHVHVPTSSPRPPLLSPPSNLAPPPASLSISPPHHTTPPPLLSPPTPVILPPHNSSLPPSLSPRTPVQPLPPITSPPLVLTPNIPLVPPPDAAPPQCLTPTVPEVSPPSSSALPPSLTPKIPIVSAPSYSAPPPSSIQTNPVESPPPDLALPPILTPTTPKVSPPYSALPPSSTPKLPVVSAPTYPPSSMQTNPIVSPPADLDPPSLTPVVPSSPSNSAPPPFLIGGLAPTQTPSAPPQKSTISVPGSPVATPSRISPPEISPSVNPTLPGDMPPIPYDRNKSNNKAPFVQLVPPALSPTSMVPPNSSASHHMKPGESPTVLPDLNVPPAPNPASSSERNRAGIPASEPPQKMPIPLPPTSHSSAPSPKQPIRHSDAHAPPPSPILPPNKGYHSNASSPSTSFPSYQFPNDNNTAQASSYFISPIASSQPDPLVHRGRESNPPPAHPESHVTPAPSPAPVLASSQTEMPISPPKISPGPSTKSPKVPPLPLIQALPPPPPSDCTTTVCTEPYTNTPPGAPCGCVLPMQVGLRLSVALYTFFPLVSELAAEIAAGVFMKKSQVRIMGANAASQQPDKTVVLIDLVPLGEKFDNTSALLTNQRFWQKQVVIQSSFFGDYEVLYVRYPGLPPPPPSASSDIGDDGSYSDSGNNARTEKPEGVDVPKRRRRIGLNGGIVAVIVLSAFVAVLLCSAIAWVLLFKFRDDVSRSEPAPGPSQQSHAKPSGAAGSIIGSGLESSSLSFGSSIVTYTGSAKTFSASELERATGKFDVSRILGEGGFGRVYSGVLEDGTQVAVKVLKRDDQQGSREFLAEVEMLSRLHHRNLVKLIGICVEEHARCLVYELIPNGSVESHLHGIDKESSPLGWDARLKIALGAARGLAYLHEDSSPRVIHRDFKSSNILLEHDFTPKVSDFGLARTAMDEENTHISTRVMGTFGYVAPEYAMTGHLLVKSDVYSYGVVLLELLTGRKPVDMRQLPGQENLVAWARPLLASKEGLETIMDQSLGEDIPFDSVAKVAAIASMCVQPEVSHRPFMGEVVQALKLVCNECDEAKETGSRSLSLDDLSIDIDVRTSTSSGQLLDQLPSKHSASHYDLGLDTERGMPMSDFFDSSARYRKDGLSGSLRRYSSSGPLRMGSGKQLWQNVRRLSTGNISEYSGALRFWPRSH